EFCLALPESDNAYDLFVECDQHKGEAISLDTASTKILAPANATIINLPKEPWHGPPALGTNHRLIYLTIVLLLSIGLYGSINYWKSGQKQTTAKPLTTAGQIVAAPAAPVSPGKNFVLISGSMVTIGRNASECNLPDCHISIDETPAHTETLSA